MLAAQRHVLSPTSQEESEKRERTADERDTVLAAFDEILTANAGPLLGSDLGLYISHSLAELIGGEITFESFPGGGSTFALEVTGRGSA